MSLNIAARALNANQAALNVIGHNISNANSVGYSRQTVSLEAVPGQRFGNGYFGKGVEVAAVKRSYDAYLTKQANATRALASADEVRFQKMQQVEALFPLGAGSLGSLLNDALNAWVDVQTAPTDSTARQVVIDRADTFAARVRETHSRLQEIGQTAKLQTRQVVQSINQYAEQIAAMNERIMASVSAGVPPNDFLDQRDRALAELNKLVNVNTVPIDDGSISVFVGGGQPLVLAGRAGQLAVLDDPIDPVYRQRLEFKLGTNTSLLDETLLLGGELKGLQNFVNTDLGQALGELGRMALATAVEINLQHQSGVKPDGTPGGRFFDLSVPVTSPTGSPVPFTLQFKAQGLTAEDYTVRYTGANTGTIQRASDGAYWSPAPVNQWVTTPTPINFASYTAASPLKFDGVEFVPTTPGAANQVFHFAPARSAAHSLTVALSQPGDVAAASRITLTPAVANTGTGVIESFGLALHNEAGGFPSPIHTFSLTYNSATSSFAIGGVTPALGSATLTPPASVPYQPGQPMTITYNNAGPPARSYSYQFTLRGEPANGDQFSVGLVNPGDAIARFNSGNAASILALRDRPVFDGAVVLSDAYVAAFSAVGAKLNTTKSAAQFSAAQATHAETQRANVSGVNLDEEASLLIQYQQAYQASAKYMTTVQTLFDTLLSTFR